MEPVVPTYVFSPIGFVRTPFGERAEAPRQAVLADVAGRIELLPRRGFELALEGLESWERIWVLFVFHKNVEQGRGWRPKVLPPRSDRKRGVFATRSPHRPNAIGMSAVRVERVDGLVVHVRDLDLIDGTPVLDLKPYVAYADAHSSSKAGWLESRDPVEPWAVAFSPRAAEQIAWLDARGVGLGAVVARTLAIGPEPHAYRRIRVRGGRRTLAVKDWRVDFEVAERTITVADVYSGYRSSQRAGLPELELHRAFAAAFPPLAPAP